MTRHDQAASGIRYGIERLRSGNYAVVRGVPFQDDPWKVVIVLPTRDEADKWIDSMKAMRASI